MSDAGAKDARDLLWVATTLTPPEAMLPEATAAAVIGWLNEHLALYANECIALRQELAHRDRMIDLLTRAGGNPEATE